MKWSTFRGRSRRRRHHLLRRKLRKEVDSLRRFPAPYSLVGTGPWMLVSDNSFLDGWICGSVADTLQQIRNDGMAAYDLDLHVTLKQMDGDAPYRVRDS